VSQTLVPDAVTPHMCPVHLDSSRHQREERRTHVYDALIDDQNVYRLSRAQRKHGTHTQRHGRRRKSDIEGGAT